MCTAISFKTKDHYFGRTLDLEYSYDEQVVFTPRNYPFRFRSEQGLGRHHAMIGMAYVQDGYPLYYDATNEKGLSMAGLNFQDYAYFPSQKSDYCNIAAFELIPWILGQCTSAGEARHLLEKTNITGIDYSLKLGTAPLHWMISDREQSIVVESTKEGLRCFDNPVGVLTNNPPFKYQMFNLSNYVNLTSEVPANRFSKDISIETYSKGMGAFGMPGDWSSASRFVRAAFTKANSVCADSEEESVSQFFHILGSVEQTRGCLRLEEGKCQITVYTSCCNTDKGIYYYTTYENRQITAVDMREENPERTELVCYPLIAGQQIYYQNKVDLEHTL